MSLFIVRPSGENTINVQSQILWGTGVRKDINSHWKFSVDMGTVARCHFKPRWSNVTVQYVIIKIVSCPPEVERSAIKF